MAIRANFEAHVSEAGNVLPDSVRKGHNVFTQYGREWMCNLVTLSLVEPSLVKEPPPPIVPPPPVGADVPKEHRRIRWISIGDGVLPETRDVQRLQAPHLLDGVNYLAPIQTVEYFLPTAVRFTQVFDTTTFVGLPSPVTVSEAGLFIDGQLGYYGGYYQQYYTPPGYYDYYYGAGLNTASADNPPVFYKAMDPLTVNVGVQTLTITWELRF